MIFEGREGVSILNNIMLRKAGKSYKRSALYQVQKVLPSIS